MKVILAGGGTGGHLFPGVAIAEELKRQEPNSEVLFVVGRNKSESVIITRYGFNSRCISAGRIAGKIRRGCISAVFRLIIGVLQSFSIIVDFKPDIIIGMGSYISAPVVFAGCILRKICVIQEQNYIPGMANRFLSKFVYEVETAFPETENLLSCRNVCVSGNPVRRSILSADRSTGMQNLELSGDKLNLIVFGGSLGAHAINLAVLEVLKQIQNNPSQRELLKSWRIIHITGKSDYPGISQAYKSDRIPALVFPFVDEMENIYGVADLVICRAGANTVAELTALGLPAIYIPYPWASNNHQEYNARWVCDRGAGVLVPDNELSADRFCNCLIELMSDDDKREKLSLASRKLGKPEAARMIVERMKCLKK